MLSREAGEAAMSEAKWRQGGIAVAGLVLALLAAPAATRAQTIPGALPEAADALSKGEWPAYAGTYAAAHYSPLTEINRDNARHLHVIWRWTSPDMAIKAANPDVGPSHANESTPLMVDGVLYTSTSLSEVAAIDALTGKTKWVFDPKVYKNGLGLPPNLGWTHRGVGFWRNGDDERIVILTAFAQMIALDARTGRPVPGFGTDGRVDLATGLRRPVARDYYTMTSPPLIDPPAAPNLIDMTVDGKPIKAVAQVTKQAFIFVFDRVTGEPVWPIDEQPVPAAPRSARPAHQLRDR